MSSKYSVRRAIDGPFHAGLIYYVKEKGAKLARKFINPMNGNESTPRHGSWRFGPMWPGSRCLAKTRSGALCQKPALKGKARCQLHGGRAGAPEGPRNGNYRLGNFTKLKKKQAREAHKRIDALMRLAKAAGILR